MKAAVWQVVVPIENTLLIDGALLILAGPASKASFPPGLPALLPILGSGVNSEGSANKEQG